MWSQKLGPLSPVPGEQRFSAGARGIDVDYLYRPLCLSFFISLSLLAPSLFLHALSLLAEQEMSQWGTDVRVVQSPPER